MPKQSGHRSGQPLVLSTEFLKAAWVREVGRLTGLEINPGLLLGPLVPIQGEATSLQLGDHRGGAGPRLSLRTLPGLGGPLRATPPLLPQEGLRGRSLRRAGPLGGPSSLLLALLGLPPCLPPRYWDRLTVPLPLTLRSRAGPTPSPLLLRLPLRGLLHHLLAWHSPQHHLARPAWVKAPLGSLPQTLRSKAREPLGPPGLLLGDLSPGAPPGRPGPLALHLELLPAQVLNLCVCRFLRKAALLTHPGCDLLQPLCPLQGLLQGG